MAVTRSVVFDFDGTLAIGHGPVLAYAKAVAPSAGEAFVSRVEEALRAFDAGSPMYRDGYHIVGELAAQDGVSSWTMQQAYQTSREILGTAKAPVKAPDEVVPLLEGLSQHAHVHLATNAPRVGVERVLDSWGVYHCFDQLHFNVGKPDGLYPILRQLLKNGPVLAVGDIIEFDLQPAFDLGADTALVGATATGTNAEVTMRGATLTDLRGELCAWVSQSPTLTPPHSPSHPTPSPKGISHA
ncbi:HAD family hydrolase [Corynebacterium auris]|uniref:HAD family hydrolase n=1 Tax=Corynebacterium auris TaxID=44750 RepID=UPI0025B4A194|nr:HAD family hydrolase [Corynebacterium auris]